MKKCLIKRYVTSLNGVRRAENTLTSYARQLEVLHDFLSNEYNIGLYEETIKEVKGYMLDNYLNSRTDIADSTRNTYVSYIKAFFKYCLDNDYIDDDPSKALRHVRIVTDEVEDEQRALDNTYTAEEVEELLNGVGKRNGVRNRAMIALFLGSGLRASELCSLNLGDIRNMRNGTFVCKRKGGGRFRVPLAEFALDYILEHMADFQDCKDDHPLFITEQGGRMNRVAVYRTISAAQKKIGKATGVHRLRHAFLSELNSIGVNSAILRDVASHSNLQTTSGYVHSTLSERADAVSRLSWS